MGMFSTSEDALQSMMTKIYNTLRDRGVPEVRLPEPKHLISHIMLWVDDKKMTDWIEAFAKLETINDQSAVLVTGTPASPGSEALALTGDAVLKASNTVNQVASSILSAVKKTIVRQKTT